MKARSAYDPAVIAYRERLAECASWVECLALSDPEDDEEEDTLPGDPGADEKEMNR